MVTTQGFNALLKLVEEPPPHLKFVFATTEPEKVIGTIRSRTHHYPFRLIPPRTLSAYLAELCDREGVKVDPAALPLVVRAGGGSARDSLSVLDQLIGGAGDAGRHLRAGCRAARLHPRHPARRGRRRLRGAVTARSVFGVVDKVIETGQDPRRFTEDLLRRLRDLLIIAAVPDATAIGSRRRTRGPGRAAGRAGRTLRPRRPVPGCRPRRRGAHRAEGRHRATAAARADLRAGAAARRRRLGTAGLATRIDRLEKRCRHQWRTDGRAATPPVEPRRRPPPRPVAATAERTRAPSVPRPPARRGPSPARAGDQPRRLAATSRRGAGAAVALRAQHRRRTPAVARRRRQGQAHAPGRPGSCSATTRRSSPSTPGRDARVQDRGLRDQFGGSGQRRDPAAGAHRRGRPGLAGRRDRRPLRPARHRAATVRRSSRAGASDPAARAHRRQPEVVRRLRATAIQETRCRRRRPRSRADGVAIADADPDDPDADDPVSAEPSCSSASWAPASSRRSPPRMTRRGTRMSREPVRRRRIRHERPAPAGPGDAGADDGRLTRSWPRRRSTAPSVDGLVTVTVNGTGELVRVQIRGGSFDPTTPRTSRT